jgi:hypothetical protein
MVLKAKHIVEEINGTRCTIVEKGASAERIEFLKNLLEFNQFEALVAEEPAQPQAEAQPGEPQAGIEPAKLFTIGVTDLIFNPVIAVYELKLKTPDGKKVSPAYWEQYTADSKDEYWEFKK